MDLVLVSHHPERVRELKKVLQEALPHVNLFSIADFPQYTHEKIEATFLEQRATQKCMKAVDLLSKPCLADESGLIVPALGKERIWAEELNVSGIFVPDTKRILQELQHVDEIERAAFLECSLSFATPENGLIRSATCRIEGVISTEERGRSLFDFSSIFIKYEYSKTLAELTPSVQARISHRRKACEKLLPFLRSYFLK